ncbi:MAG: M43 family zinc metalloprotease, partial [Nitrospira sp.]|nr:M43 family zinc metalloprotease [Nitrospira sp.]
RISVKFILDANGNRPAVGNMNTDTEIWNEINQGISILRDVITEYSIDTVEFVDLSGLSQWYSTSATSTGRDAVRNAAIADQVTYHWRTDALNIYINGGTGSAISDFPPNNNMILMNQWCGNTPSCTLHEMGHSLNLLHTHEGGGSDGCSDTLSDDSSWTTKDQMAQNNFGTTFANLTAGQQDQVNMTWNNIMSYHTDEPQRRISPCQMDRASSQGYGDRWRLYTRIPIYVNRNAPLWWWIQDGSFVFPYENLQNALNAGGYSSMAFVLQQGSFNVNIGSTINTNVELITRSGASEVHAPGVQKYTLPVDLTNSANPQVSSAVRAAQGEDSNARAAVRDAEAAAASAAGPREKAAILSNAGAISRQHSNNAINHLLNAEQFAAGDEKIAVQFELAQRYRDAGDCAHAIKFFRLVADATEQPYLREEVLREANKCAQTLITPAQPEVPVPGVSPIDKK